MRWSDQQLDKLRQSYFSLSKDEMVKNIGKSWNAIKLKAIGLGIKRSKGLRCQANLNKLLEETDEAYYWIGMLLADGCFHNLRLKLEIIDSDSKHVDKLKTFIEYKGYQWGNNKCSVMNKEIIPKIMRKFNIIQNKTINPPDLSFIKNDDLFLSLVIGYIDGDGNITKQKNRQDCFIRIQCHSSWLENLNYFNHRLSKLANVKPANVRINNRGYAFVYWANSELLKLLKIKAKTLPVLDRKWGKINESFSNSKLKYSEIRRSIINLYISGDKKFHISKKLGISPAMVTQVTKGVNGVRGIWFTSDTH